jgi:copper chaperone CopZ
MKILIAAFIASLTLAGPAWAETQTATIDLDMDCPSSEMMAAKIALTRIAGVSLVTVSPDELSVEVVYDDTQTSVPDLLGILLDLGLDVAERTADAPK